MGTTRCSRCGRPAREADTYCGGCGQALPPAKAVRAAAIVKLLTGPPSEAPRSVRIAVRLVILTVMAAVFSQWSRIESWSDGSCVGWATVDAPPPALFSQGIHHPASVAHVQVTFPAGMGFRDFPLSADAETSLRGLVEAERARSPFAPSSQSASRPRFTAPAIPRPAEAVEVYCRLYYRGEASEVHRVESLAPPDNAVTRMKRMRLP